MSEERSVVELQLTLHSYDPDYEQWEFGKLSAMREIAMTLEDDYKYYYMGRSPVHPFTWHLH